jgi:hypothetical protein
MTQPAGRHIKGKKYEIKQNLEGAKVLRFFSDALTT